MHSPLALVILMLGTNDFQAIHQRTARDASRAVGDLVEAIRLAPIEPGMPVPPVLIVVPPTIVAPAGTMADKFAGAEWKSKGLAQEYLQVAQDLGCPIFDANSVTSPSRIDGIHLDADQHESLGCALAAAARPFLDPSPQTK